MGENSNIASTTRVPQAEDEDVLDLDLDLAPNIVRARQLAELHLAKLAPGEQRDLKLDSDFAPVAMKYGRAKLELFIRQCSLLVECREEVAATCGKRAVTAWKEALVGRGLGGMSNIEAMLSVGNKALADPVRVKLELDKWVKAVKPVNVKLFAAKLVPRRLPPPGGNASPPPASSTTTLDGEAAELDAYDNIREELEVPEEQAPESTLEAVRLLKAENERLRTENAALRSEVARLSVTNTSASNQVPEPTAPE